MNNNEISVFLIFIIVGILLALLFDIFRILRKSFKTSDLITVIEDICYWIIAGTFLIYSVFVYNNGELRLYIFLGIGIGIIFYLAIASKFVISLCVKLINKLKSIIKKLIKILLIPINYVVTFFHKSISKPISFIIINLKKSFNIISKIKSNMHKNKTN